MRRTAQVGGVKAGPGEKVAGFLEVPGTNVHIPLTLVNGVNDGRTLFVTAGIHGGEYPSTEAVIRLATELQPGEVAGQIILMPLVNPESFHARQQYVLPADGKNVNRQFPGRALGTVSERIAYAVVNEAARNADAWIDLHGGDIHEALVPVVGYLEAGEHSVQERARSMVEVFGIEHVIHSKDLPGTTFKTAATLGIPCIIAEAGQGGLLDEESTESEMVRTGQCMGTIKDYFGNLLAEYSAPADGMVLLLATSLAMNVGDPLLGLGVV
jgi:predicted deacylase